MTFDTARGEMVLLTMGSMQTWTFDGTKWTQRHPATSPSPGLWVFQMAYDPTNRLAVFFCGETTSGKASYPLDTWAWNGSDWKKLASTTVPPATIDYAFEYYPEGEGFVLHGGWGDPGWSFRSNVWFLKVENAAPCYPAPSGLIGWWPAENEYNDIAGPNNAQAVGGVSFGPGGCGRGFLLDGASSYVQVLQPVAMPVGNQPRTIALWFNSDRNLSVSTESALVQYGSPANSQMCGLITSLNAPGCLYFYGHSLDLAGRTVLQTNRWYHGAVTYDGSRVRLYLNGQLESSRDGSLNTVLNADGLTIGNRPGGAKWQGSLDEVLLFDRALADAEINAIYAAGSAGLCPSAPTIQFIGGQVLSTSITMVSAGQVQAGARQVLQATTDLQAAPLWFDLLTNSAPGPTNTWSVPRDTGRRFFRIVERP
jgi:hypothetical protein